MTATVQTGADIGPPKPFRVKEVADIWGVAPSTVYATLRRGELASYRVGTGRGTIRISQEALRAYAEARGIPVGASPCRLANCNGLLHDEDVCTVDLTKTSLGYISLLSYPDTEQRDLDVYSDVRNAITDPAEARELAEHFRAFAAALDESADLIAGEVAA